MLKEISVRSISEKVDSLKVINTSYVICIEPGFEDGTQLYLKDYGWLYSKQSYKEIRKQIIGETEEERDDNFQAEEKQKYIDNPNYSPS